MASLRMFIHMYCKDYFLSMKIGKNLINSSVYDNSKYNVISNKIIKRKYSKIYQAPGKTTAIVLDKRYLDVISIESIQTSGFVLTNGAEIVGSTILFPHTLLSWNVATAADVNEDSLTLFKVLDPQLDLLIFGYGSPEDCSPETLQNFKKLCKKLNIKFEAMATIQAVGAYNFLAYEHRFVAGAFIPPTFIDPWKLDRRGMKSVTIEEILEEENDVNFNLINNSSDLKRLK